MLSAVMAGRGMQEKIREKISAFTGHIVITAYDANQSGLTLRPVSLRQPFYPDNPWPEVKHIAPYATIGGLLKHGDEFEGIVFKGVDSTYHWEIFRQYLKEGNIPDFSGDRISRDILVSAEMARRLRLRPGDKVKAYFLREGSDKPLMRRLRVAGIYETDFEDYDRAYVWGDLRQVQKLYGWNDTLTGGFEILLHDFGTLRQTTARINEDIPPLLQARSIVDLNPLIFDWLSMFDFNVAFIIAVLIFISALNMATVLLVMIMERTRMIGILKTLGATDRSIIRIFLLKAAFLISVGLVIGNLIVWVIYVLQKKYGFIRLNPEIYYVKTSVFHLDWKTAVGLNLLVILLILAALLLPARMIAGISPSRIMKHD